MSRRFQRVLKFTASKIKTLFWGWGIKTIGNVAYCCVLDREDSMTMLTKCACKSFGETDVHRIHLRRVDNGKTIIHLENSLDTNRKSIVGYYHTMTDGIDCFRQGSSKKDVGRLYLAPPPLASPNPKLKNSTRDYTSLVEFSKMHNRLAP